MSLITAILLGVLQGLTEFLPVSSSGHLALAQMLIPGFSQPGLFFDVVLHVGTMVSILVLEWGRIREAFRQGYAVRLAGLLLLGTAATAAVAFPLRARAEAAFEKPLWVAGGFALTAILLLLSSKSKTQEERLPTWEQAVAVGLAQGVAVFPGLSRSGTTISVGLAVGVTRPWAADFSFLLSLPAVAGAALVEVMEEKDALLAAGSQWLAPALAGGLAAAVTGLFALTAVRKLVRSGRLAVFAWYLLPLCLLVVAGYFLGWWA
ncbi:MAG: undecaprenyl-diphosphatase [Thermoanaerobaculum sp.]|nr:MAG: undecaprenyl-diphosphatase [Thermoanaerobaculum sp.]GBC79377.1 Undecaprenyl-diphosphatase [bacterium HR09]